MISRQRLWISHSIPYSLCWMMKWKTLLLHVSCWNLSRIPTSNVSELITWNYRWIGGVKPPPRKSSIWTCISYWTWGFSNVILVLGGVCNDKRGVCNDSRFSLQDFFFRETSCSGDVQVGLCGTRPGCFLLFVYGGIGDGSGKRKRNIIETCVFLRTVVRWLLIPPWYQTLFVEIDLTVDSCDFDTRVVFYGEQNNLDGGFKHFLFSPLPGETIQFD